MTRRAPAKAPATVGTGVGPSGASAGVPEALARAHEAPMPTLVFAVFGAPQPKQRARRGKGGRWYTPERTRRYESAVRDMATLLRPRGWPTDRLYAVQVVAYMPDRRPRDLDNIAKSACDGLQGVAFDNDRQVVSVTSRIGGIDPKSPRTEIAIQIANPDEYSFVRAAGKLPKGRAKR